MRDRLIELIKQGDKTFSDKYTGKVMSHIDEVYGFVADYLLSEGVIVPPCKVGDKVYTVGEITNEIYTHTVLIISYGEDGCYLQFDGTGMAYLNECYLTQEEAEKALALAGRIKLLKPEKWQRIPLSECHLYECCCNCTEFSCSGMSAPDGYCREHSKATDAAKHCKKFKERT